MSGWPLKILKKFKNNSRTFQEQNDDFQGQNIFPHVCLHPTK